MDLPDLPELPGLTDQQRFALIVSGLLLLSVGSIVVAQTFLGGGPAPLNMPPQDAPPVSPSTPPAAIQWVLPGPA